MGKNLEICPADPTMKSVMEQEQTQKKYISDTRFWIVWGTIAGIILLGGLFYGWKIWALSQENARFETSIENTSARLKALAPGSEQLKKNEQKPFIELKISAPIGHRSFSKLRHWKPLALGSQI